MQPSQQRLLGILLVVLSAAFFSIAGVFTKMIAADAWTIIGWRGFASALLLGGYHLWLRRRETAPASLVLDWRGWAVAITSVLASSLFIVSLKYTYVANVAVIYATAPFMAAALAWLVLRERVSALTFVSATASLGGVLLIVANGLGSANLFGDVLALAMTAMFAIYIVILRRFPTVPVLWSVAAAALILFGLSGIITDPLAISARDFGICLLFGVTFSIAVILLTEGARLLPVADTALIGTLDVPFAVGFAWLLIQETPPSTTIIGGAIVVLAVAAQSVVEAVRDRSRDWSADR